MAITCPKCHSENTDTARFCSNCATSLSASRDHGPSLTKTLESPAYVVAPGTVIAGHYEVLGKLGQGGMGEVYRALDRNLGRQVAIKILPDEFSSDPERLARFEREAKLLATLNHPNIAAIYGFEEAAGRRFLALELVDGETLQTRLDRSALPMDEALETCRQVADGLEAAHDRGVVHRDLKPGNIMLTPEGKVKILDFGLAKAYTGETTGIDIANSPTITAKMTEPGVILGTAAYMSPEQARSRPVDKRTDIWSFGCVLYECLTGGRTFHGETISDILAHILKGEPDWTKLPQGTPINVRTLLRHCLEKNPKERLHDIADARIELGGTELHTAEAVIAPRRPSVGWLVAGAMAILLAGTFLGSVLTGRFKPALPSSVVITTIKVERGHWLDGMRWATLMERPSRTALAVSNDGHFIVYSAIVENPGPEAKPQIYLRRLDQINATPVIGTEGGIDPFLSPDDRWIGYWEDGKLMKVPTNGGVPAVLCDNPVPFGEDWGRDNMIVFSQYPGLSRVLDAGGKPEVLTVPEKTRDEAIHRLPHCLPDGKGVLFTIMAFAYDLHPRLALLDLRTRKWRVVMEDAADGRYLRSGHLVFLRQGTLMAVAFDLDHLEVRGQPVPIIANVMHMLGAQHFTYNSLAGQYSVSDSGQLAYVPGGIVPDMENSLVRVDWKGNVQPIADFKAAFMCPRFSPDGQKISYETRGKEWRIGVYDLKRGTKSQLVDEGWAESPVWTPDGKRIVFEYTPNLGSEVPNLYWQSSDRSSPMERLTTSTDWDEAGSFSPDGSVLAFMRYQNGHHIFLLDMKSRQAKPFMDTKTHAAWPEFSPDGRWLVYSSDESGRYEVWVQPYPGPGGKWQISKEGGQEPLWSRDGRQLFYRYGDQVWVVDIQTAGGITAGKPRLLFEQPGLPRSEPARSWDLWPDGQGFLMVKREVVKTQPMTEMVLVQNWFEELKRLVPASKK